MVDRKFKTYNLDRAFCKRDFSGELLQQSAVKYNTTKIPVSALKDISNLTVLKIERTLSEDEWNEVSQLDSVREIYFVDQNLTELPIAICDMSNLQKLFLWGNQLTSLPEQFTHLTNLDMLSVTDSPFSSMNPDDIFSKMTNLVQISR